MHTVVKPRQLLCESSVFVAGGAVCACSTTDCVDSLPPDSLTFRRMTPRKSIHQSRADGLNRSGSVPPVQCSFPHTAPAVTSIALHIVAPRDNTFVPPIPQHIHPQSVWLSQLLCSIGFSRNMASDLFC